MTDAILCVDDELSVLAAFQRQFRKKFHIVSALNSANALETLNTKGPFAVVMSDFNMPGMTGLLFLEQVRKQSPASIRLMLTGRADLETGLAALNQGLLFRFLSKPCAPETLANAFSAALEQYRLSFTEQLLKKRLVDSGIQLMTEVQKFLHPAVLARVNRIRDIVQAIVPVLKIANPEQVELAAALSHIGCIGLPGALLDRAFTEDLPVEDRSAFEKHAAMGARMIASIPGLETVAAMVEGQFTVAPVLAPDQKISHAEPVLAGAQVLRLAASFDALVQRGFTAGNALTSLLNGAGSHDPVLLSAMEAGLLAKRTRAVFPLDLEPGMITQQPIVTRDGYLLAPKGVAIVPALIKTLQRQAEFGNLHFPIQAAFPLE